LPIFDALRFGLSIVSGIGSPPSCANNLSVSAWVLLTPPIWLPPPPAALALASIAPMSAALGPPFPFPVPVVVISPVTGFEFAAAAKSKFSPLMIAVNSAIPRLERSTPPSPPSAASALSCVDKVPVPVPFPIGVSVPLGNTRASNPARSGGLALARDEASFSASDSKASRDEAPSPTGEAPASGAGVRPEGPEAMTGGGGRVDGIGREGVTACWAQASCKAQGK
jgi:hypothetical protein